MCLLPVREEHRLRPVHQSTPGVPEAIGNLLRTRVSGFGSRALAPARALGAPRSARLLASRRLGPIWLSPQAVGEPHCARQKNEQSRGHNHVQYDYQSH